MSTPLPPLDVIKHLLERLKANDIAWFRERYKAGDLAWLKDRLPAGGYEKLGERIEAGDLGWLRERIGGLPGMNIPGLDLGGLGGQLGKVGANVGANVGNVGNVARGAAGAGAAALATTTAKRSNKLWIIPILLLAAILGALGLKQCNKDDESVATDSEATEVVAETTVAEAMAETTVAEAMAETTVAAAMAETTVAATPAADGGTIVDVAGANGFNTLLAAVNAAGLGDTLKGEGPFTVFAPTDEAFAKLPAGLVDALVKPENKEILTKVLTYHVVPGKVMAADIKAGDVATVEGGNVALAVDGTTVKVNEAMVVKADVPASNGVIHVIDSVLLPAGVDPAALLGSAAPATEPAAAPETNAAGDATPEDLTVYFDNASAAINAEGDAKVMKAVEILKALPDGAVVNLVGHASKTGNAAKNQALSEQRAANVQAALEAKLGGKAITFNKAAKGDSDPVENEDKSRRVTIEIQK